MYAVEKTLRDCLLRPGPYPAAEGCCAWCGATLPPRRRRWCSDDCSRAIGRNHDWSSARQFALQRDGRRCVRCGADGSWVEGHAWWRVMRAMAPAIAPGEGSFTAGVIALAEGERAVRLEVNHITPIVGRHSQWGCHHHLDGIETLCRPCHVLETARQFADGEIRRGRKALIA